MLVPRTPAMSTRIVPQTAGSPPIGLTRLSSPSEALALAGLGLAVLAHAGVLLTLVVGHRRPRPLGCSWNSWARARCQRHTMRLRQPAAAPCGCFASDQPSSTLRVERDRISSPLKRSGGRRAKAGLRLHTAAGARTGRTARTGDSSPLPRSGSGGKPTSAASGGCGARAWEVRMSRSRTLS